MKICRSLLLPVLSLALIAGVGVAGKTPLMLDSIDLTFDSIEAKGKAKGKGLGKQGGKDDQTHTIDFTFGAGGTDTGGTFSAVWDGDTGNTFTGTYTRKNECSKKLTIELDSAGVLLLEDEYEAFIAELLEDEGFVGVLGLQLTKQKNKLNLKVKKKKNEATGKVRFRLTFSGVGSIPELGVNNQPFTVTGTMKGTSQALVATDITGV